MTTLVALLGFVVLFVVFGLVPGERTRGCGGGTCGGEGCDTCPREGAETTPAFGEETR